MRGSVELVEGEADIAGQAKVVDGQGGEEALGLAEQGGLCEFGETVGDVEDAVDQEAVGGALDLKVAEEGVCAEEVKDLVEDIIVGCRGVGRAPVLGVDGEQAGVADDASIRL